MAQYDAAIAGITTAACPCASDGIPQCVMGQCTICTGPTCGIVSPPPDGGTDTIGCKTTTGGTTYCYTYTGLPPSTESAVESACTSGSGTVIMGPCPTTGAAG